MNAEDDEETTSGWEWGTIHRGTCLFHFRHVRMEYFRWEEREREKQWCVQKIIRHLIKGWTFIIDVSEYREASRFIRHRQRISSCKGWVYRNVVLTAHASDWIALSFLPLLAQRSFAKSALPLSRSGSRCSSLWYSTASYINFYTEHWLMPVPRDRADRWRGARDEVGAHPAREERAGPERGDARSRDGQIFVGHSPWNNRGTLRCDKSPSRIVQQILEIRRRQRVSRERARSFPRGTRANWFSSHLAINVN